MMIKEANITINIKDINQSVSFYESLGMEIKQRWGDHYAQLVAPGVTIGLHPATDANLPGNSGNISIGFTTDDLEETKKQLEKLNVGITNRDEAGGRFLHFIDPDGTALYFIKPNW